MPVRAVVRFASSASSSSVVLRQGARGPYVTQLQNLLRQKGFRVSADGVFGPGTAAALRTFQKRNGLTADGVAGPKTWAKLRAGSGSTAQASSSGSPTLRLGARGAAVKQMQQLLRNKGYRVSADGVFGPGTLNALKQFQRARGLGADGVAGPRTWQALRSSGGSAPVGSAPTGPTRTMTGYRNGRPQRVQIASVGGGQSLNARAAGPFKAMVAAAKRAGIHLTCTSGFRTHAQQQALWRRYGPPRAARPGYSNHQMGLSMDIGGINGYNTKAYRWLKANAHRYGFVNDVRGEWWHWTYRR